MNEVEKRHEVLTLSVTTIGKLAAAELSRMLGARTATRRAGLAGVGLIFLCIAATAFAGNAPFVGARDVTAAPFARGAFLSELVTAVPATSEKLEKDESFTDQSKVEEYKFNIDNSTGMVRLKVDAEIHHGRVQWELIDPSGTVRSRVGTTERGSMDTDGIKAIKGEWLLRMTLEDATGKYRVRWTQ